MSNKTITKKERKKLVTNISKVSGVAQYAIEAKMSDDNLIKLSKHLDILQLLKSSNDYNRHCQRQKTAEANNKLKKFLNPENSEILNTGKWLLNALSLSGVSRKEALSEKDLIHKEDYDKSVEDFTGVIEEQNEGINRQSDYNINIIQKLEQRNDNLRKQLISIKKYISDNLSTNTWNNIRQYINEKEINDYEEFKFFIYLNKEEIINKLGVNFWQKIIKNFIDEDEDKQLLL